MYNTVTTIYNAIKNCIGFFWYPVKERCVNCCDKCDKCLNPHKDPAYSEIDDF